MMLDEENEDVKYEWFLEKFVFHGNVENCALFNLCKQNMTIMHDTMTNIRR